MGFASSFAPASLSAGQQTWHRVHSSIPGAQPLIQCVDCLTGPMLLLREKRLRAVCLPESSVVKVLEIKHLLYSMKDVQAWGWGVCTHVCLGMCVHVRRPKPEEDVMCPLFYHFPTLFPGDSLSLNLELGSSQQALGSSGLCHPAPAL